MKGRMPEAKKVKKDTPKRNRQQSCAGLCEGMGVDYFVGRTDCSAYNADKLLEGVVKIAKRQAEYRANENCQKQDRRCWCDGDFQEIVAGYADITSKKDNKKHCVVLAIYKYKGNCVEHKAEEKMRNRDPQERIKWNTA